MICITYNDELRNPVIARDEAIQKQATQSGLLRTATNDKLAICHSDPFDTSMVRLRSVTTSQ